MLSEVAGAADPALAPYAVSDPGEPRFGPELGPRRFVLEVVYEGYLLHYGRSRVYAGMDGDLCLLAGDALYALGLARLAEQDDLEAVAGLCEVIARSAQAHAEGLSSTAVEEFWDASALSLGGAPR